MNIYSVIKPIAFKLDPEKIHDMIIYTGAKKSTIGLLPGFHNNCENLALNINQFKWRTPVGLAAGFDKNGQALDFFSNIGFGAIEAGTITKLPQVGNDKPRIWRHPNLLSIQNAMGFPNQGADKILENIKKRKIFNTTLGINIGKNKNTTDLDTPSEYAYLYQKFAPIADYLVINISSPNTPGLRSFQKKELLSPILEAVTLERTKIPKPLVLKISPDMDTKDIATLCELSKEFKLSGIIATNTTADHKFGVGGLSGEYLRDKAFNTRKLVCENLREDKSQIIIGVGAIESYQDIKDFWKLGGSFVQIYTSFIYQGPQILNTIYNEMRADMKKNQFLSVQELYDNILMID